MSSSFRKMIMMANQAKNRVYWNQFVNGCVSFQSEFIKTDIPEPNGYGYKVGYNNVQGINGYQFMYNGIHKDNKGAIDLSHKYLVRQVYQIDDANGGTILQWYACSQYNDKLPVSSDIVTKEKVIPQLRLYDRPGWLYMDDGTGQRLTWKGYIECQIYDLTLMFGAGNEPDTVEEFHERIEGIPIDIYAYNPGELIEW